MTTRPGMTMLELIVVVAIMGIMAGFVGLAAMRMEPPAAPGTIEAARATVADARRAAIRNGAPVSVAVSVDAGVGNEGSVSAMAGPLHAIAFPDGSVIADPALGIDRLTGKPQRAARSSGR